MARDIGLSLLELVSKPQEQVDTDVHITFVRVSVSTGRGTAGHPGSQDHCRARADYQGNIKGVVTHRGLDSRSWWGGPMGWREYHLPRVLMLACLLGMPPARRPFLGPSPTSGWGADELQLHLGER